MGNKISPQQKRTLKLFAILSMGWMFYALDGSAIGVLFTNQTFHDTFALDANRLGLFGLAPAIGALIATMGPGGAINRWLGRRKTFQFSTILIMIGVILQTFPDVWALLILGRIMMGFGGDTNGMCIGTYVAEIAPKEHRGKVLLIVQQFASQLIGIAGNWICYGIAYLPQDKAYSWKVANSLQFVPGVLFVTLTFFLPESPRWLARKDASEAGDLRVRQALANIRCMHPDDEAIVQEADEIRQYDTWTRTHSSVSIWNVFQRKNLFKRVFGWGMVPQIASQFMGVGTIGIYAVIIYQSLGLTTQHATLLLNACLSILYMFAARGSSFVVDRFGRRTCMLIGMTGNTIGLAIISGILIGLENKGENKVANGFVVAFITLNQCIYWLFYTGPATIYTQEILPNHVRELGVGWSAAIPIGIAVAIGQQWPTATEKLGAKSYLIFLATSTVGTILIYFFTKEPKGLSIERIDALFGESDHVEDMKGASLAHSQVEPIEYNLDAKTEVDHIERKSVA